MRDINILKNNGFDVDSVFDTFGDIELYEEILNDFYVETFERARQIIKHKKEKNYKDYAILVHTIKGECMYLGIKKLADMSYEHQLKAQEEDGKYLDEHFDEYMNELARVLSTIKKYYNK